MRIGIVTLPLHTNYGGILQAYALQTVLESQGHSVKVLSRDIKYTITPYHLFVRIPLRIVKRFFGINEGILNEIRFNVNQNKLRKNVEPTIRKFIHRDMRRLCKIKKSDYDCFIVGSDQIWRPKYIVSLGLNVDDAFLSFARNWNVKRISYAASFGTDEWEFTSEGTKRIIELVKKFDAVSVREISGVSLCENFLGIKAEHVLDPTMLLTKEDYIENFEIEQEPLSCGKIMTYILDFTEQKQELVDIISDGLHMLPFSTVSKIDDRNAPLQERVQPRLQTFLRGFYDAEFVVTDSFHACVFSVLFGKPFIAIGNKERGLSRIESLLGTLGLEDHLICDLDMYDDKKDYTIPESTYEKLDEMRKLSMSFLSNIC